MSGEGAPDEGRKDPLDVIQYFGLTADGEWAIYVNEATGNYIHVPTRTYFEELTGPHSSQSGADRTE